MWESRPLSTIAPKPLAAHSARGFVFYFPLPSFLPLHPTFRNLPVYFDPPPEKYAIEKLVFLT